jgi:hypothetical protein
LVIIVVTGFFEQSDTKVKTRLFRLRLEIQVKSKYRKLKKLPYHTPTTNP